MMDPSKKFVTYLESDLPKVVFSGPASPRTHYSLHVNGPFTSKECGNIIAILELHKQWLIEDEAAASPQEPSP